MSDDAPPRNFLEIPDDVDARRDRRFTVVDDSRDPSRASVSKSKDDDDTNVVGPPVITKSTASPLLAKLASFLPEMERANDALVGRGREEIDIEELGDPEGARIEMDLGLGVVDLKTKEAVKAAAASAGVDNEDEDEEDEEEELDGREAKKSKTTLVIPNTTAREAKKTGSGKKVIEEL